MDSARLEGPRAYFSELFGTRRRYSGASLGYQLASVFAGGFSRTSSSSGSSSAAMSTSLVSRAAIVAITVITPSPVMYSATRLERRFDRERFREPAGTR